nr:uncharacterized protein LOC118680898 [Bactrocera oleae]
MKTNIILAFDMSFPYRKIQCECNNKPFLSVLFATPSPIPAYIRPNRPHPARSEELRFLPFHSEKTTAWFGLCAGGIIGQYFFKNDAGENVTVNGDCYRAMITDYLMPEIEARDLGDIWFQQEFIGEHLDEKIITHFGPVDWP